jgi:hypothetical protein
VQLQSLPENNNPCALPHQVMTALIILVCDMFHCLLMGSRLLIFAKNCELGIVVFCPCKVLERGAKC